MNSITPEHVHPVQQARIQQRTTQHLALFALRIRIRTPLVPFRVVLAYLVVLEPRRLQALLRVLPYLLNCRQILAPTQTFQKDVTEMGSNMTKKVDFGFLQGITLVAGYHHFGDTT